ncbi:bifunctional 2-polyprenyl-6-hydroxyphenol methylase/3-demethylubiquinol 3-O-methyltransferase UbiG [Silanimonas sp.]|jgi:2-polyprenyl-6-hydroxyphenyl methylase/3-demethylubiquinone-9 3-methyltransferase|uniref:bifunctional 2-polyprenyl-6-hydroxyphenol methylase/3-demethylubiquinol 3-O-methyltransferase UbiG n=1 Tax=Silanimonas sp. TaxID=1929290 RepID=UPI0022C3115D|nr:bifunctional 2-polyprenyl-6-hydroxyphenol methylase/3-demethylubiquinol 3-O-methyltransferase UbiG [Silanimonas sp.]MCZ8165173.1 bifunctional 2-polyprenyl-6-hydroxyphenol methylase/3-demethylubiquinol 3-O-methyltransferase UbiG [Silanimonas sp.]
MSAPVAPANVNPAEVAKFSALANRWWDPDGPQAPLHVLNPARLGYVAARQPLRGARVLDVGCGGGLLSEAMAREGARVLGLDLSPELIDIAKLHRLESTQGGAILDLEYRVQAVEALAAAEPASFDAITCMEMLEHVPEPGSILEACARLLKPGGRLFVSTINRTPAAFALAIVGAEYIAGLLAKGTHDYRSFIKPSEITRVLRAVGLDVEDASGLHYDPLRKSAKVAPGTRVNYLLSARKPG